METIIILMIFHEVRNLIIGNLSCNIWFSFNWFLDSEFSKDISLAMKLIKNNQ